MKCKKRRKKKVSNSFSGRTGIQRDVFKISIYPSLLESQELDEIFTFQISAGSLCVLEHHLMIEAP